MTQSPQDAPNTSSNAEPAGASSGEPVAATDTGSSESGKSIVSKNFSIHGDLTCQDVLHIDGSVEGNIVCQQLTVSQAGRVNGDIRADTVDMRGTLTGAIDARVLTLSKSSNVVGDIVVHETLGIEPGASFDGSCKKLGAADANNAVDENAAGDDAPGAPEMEAAEPQAPAPEAAAPEAAAPDTATAEPETSGTEAPAELDMLSAAKTDAGELAGESMSSALDKVAAELKASIGRAASDKAPDPGPAAALPDPSEPPENFADAMAKPAINGGAAPAAAAAPTDPPAAPAPAKPAAAPATAAPGPVKPAAASNGAAPTG